MCSASHLPFKHTHKHTDWPPLHGTSKVFAKFFGCLSTPRLFCADCCQPSFLSIHVLKRVSDDIYRRLLLWVDPHAYLTTASSLVSFARIPCLECWVGFHNLTFSPFCFFAKLAPFVFEDKITFDRRMYFTRFQTSNSWFRIYFLISFSLLRFLFCPSRMAVMLISNHFCPNWVTHFRSFYTQNLQFLLLCVFIWISFWFDGFLGKGKWFPSKF